MVVPNFLTTLCKFLKSGHSTGLDLLSNLRITVFKCCGHQTSLDLLPYNSKMYYLEPSSSSTVHVNDWLVFCVVPVFNHHSGMYIFPWKCNHSHSFRQHVQPDDSQICVSLKLQKNIYNNLLHIFRRISRRHFILTCPKQK